MNSISYSTVRSVLFCFGILFILSLIYIPNETSAVGITGAYFASSRNLLLIEGSNFGASQGGSTVLVDGTTLGIATSWSDTDLYFASPGKSSGTVVVNVSGGSVYTATISRLSTYTSYPSDPDQNNSSLASYFPFDSNFEDIKGPNNLAPQNLKLYGSGLFGGKYEAIQTFSNPTSNDITGTDNKRSIIKIGGQLLMMFYDGTNKYTVSSDGGAIWSTPAARPDFPYLGLPIKMENSEWLYIQSPTWPTATITPCHATGVTIENIWSPPNLTCLSPVSISQGAVYYQWQYEYLGNGRIVLPTYRYWGLFGGVIIKSEDYGYNWESVLMSDTRIVTGLTLASPITAGDTQITLTDASGLTESGFIKFTNGATVETVTYGYKTGNTLHNVRKGNGGQYLVGSELDAQTSGTTNSFIVSGTAVKQDVATLGEPTVLADPANSNHLIMLQRHEGGGGSYVFRSESNDFGDTWSTFKIIYLDSYETGAPVRANNFHAYWTTNAGGAQGRIYIFARHWHGTRYFYSDDQGITWHGNNTQTSNKIENNYSMRVGNTWLLANDMNNVIEADDKTGLWLYWAIAIDEDTAPGTGTNRGALAKTFFSYDDSTTGKNLGYAFNDYNSSYDLPEYSIDFWANLRQTHRNIDGTIISRMSSDGAKANYDIKIIGNGVNQNKIQFRQYNDLTSTWNTIISKTAFSNDEWHHVAAVYDRNKIKLYINGKLEASLDSTSTHSGNEKLQIGYDSARDQLLFRGQLDNLKIYNTALSSKEILERYNWQQPAISSISPASLIARGTITITGSGFGASQGQNTLKINGQITPALSWVDTEIKASTPSLAPGSYGAVINVSGYDSNSKSFDIISVATPIIPPVATATSSPNENNNGSLASTPRILSTFRRTISNLVKNLDTSLSISAIFENIIYNFSDGIIELPTGNPTLYGNTSPNSKVEIFIHSEPRHYETISRSDGYWEYMIDEPLETGPHQLHITVVAPDNSFRISDTFNFLVIEKSQAEEKISEPVEQSDFNILKISLIILIFLIILTLIFINIKSKTKN